ncbi:hypothetical protein DFH28DRAFT_899141 [Melampsora americana]|nr:hypothetical protein DFH28DRAFT_899141 [Melampsora americana]
MLEKLPTEIQEEIIHHLIELDREGNNNFTYPYTGKSRSARSLAALSLLNWNFGSVCESFLWRTLGFSRPRRPNELEALSEIGPRIRHIRSLRAQVSLSNSGLPHSAVIDNRCLDYFSDLKDLLENLSQCSLKHVRLYTPCNIEMNRLIWLEQTNNLLFNQLRIAHQEVTYGLFNFPLLTSLEISGACYAFVPEDDIAQCIRQLPHLVRFRAHNSVAPYHLDPPRKVMLGRALASLCSLEELSLQNLGTPDQSWCDLDWKGPLKVLSIKRCLNLTGEALYEFILKFPNITNIRLYKNAWPGLKSVVFSLVPPEDETRLWLENWAHERLIRIRFHGTQHVPLPPWVDHAIEDQDENHVELDQHNQNPVDTSAIQPDVDATMADFNNDDNAEVEASVMAGVVAIIEIFEDLLGDDDDHFEEEEFDEHADLDDNFPPGSEDNGFLSEIQADEAVEDQLEDAASGGEESDSDFFGTDSTSQVEEDVDSDDSLDEEDAISVPGSHCSEMEELEDWSSSSWIRDHE